MNKLPLLIFIFLVATAFCSCICSYKQTETYINNDANNALAMTLKQMPCDVVTTDTIRCYRDFITVKEVRDTAYIAVRSTRKDGRQKTELMAEAGCDFATVFGMSDQRASGTLMLVAILWLFASSVYARRQNPELVAQGILYGGMTLAKGRFKDNKGNDIRLTPMQFELMEMFFGSSEIWSDKLIKKKKTTEHFVYLYNHKQMYGNEQQFSISCLGTLQSHMHSRGVQR